MYTAKWELLIQPRFELRLKGPYTDRPYEGDSDSAGCRTRDQNGGGIRRAR